jgi:hypothetical protein
MYLLVHMLEFYKCECITDNLRYTVRTNNVDQVLYLRTVQYKRLLGPSAFLSRPDNYVARRRAGRARPLIKNTSARLLLGSE